MKGIKEMGWYEATQEKMMNTLLKVANETPEKARGMKLLNLTVNVRANFFWIFFFIALAFSPLISSGFVFLRFAISMVFCMIVFGIVVTTSRYLGFKAYFCEQPVSLQEIDQKTAASSGFLQNHSTSRRFIFLDC